MLWIVRSFYNPSFIFIEIDIRLPPETLNQVKNSCSCAQQHHGPHRSLGIEKFLASHHQTPNGTNSERAHNNNVRDWKTLA